MNNPTSKRIVYWSPDYTSPVGGVKILYRHVDVLNEHGFSATILHRHRGFRCSWFENATQISYLRGEVFGPDDIIVVPETYASLYGRSSPRQKARKQFLKVFTTPAKKVIFNQNTYNTFTGDVHTRDEPASIYRDKDVLAAMVVSEDNRNYLRYAFGAIPVFRIHNSIHPALFPFEVQKKRQISFMPRKNHEHALQVLSLLRHRCALNDFTIVPIENKTEKETAAILRESLIFLSFGYPEGFSLPPAEAMACGCVVIGYHGMGGREYFLPEHCYPVEMGDILAFAKTVEHVIHLSKSDPQILDDKRQKASAYIHAEFCQERETADILKAWGEILTR
ncbi:MAG: glycosyltransferase [Desulfomonilia bacterium]